jgi:glycosyltransferase involved in cell wall biosynthesis
VHPDLQPCSDIATFRDDAILLCAVVKDEALRLPYFLEYYRALGVSDFLIVDNGSTDGTDAILDEAPDVVRFHTTASYAASRCGIHWVNALLGTYAHRKWALHVDADELLVLPAQATLSDVTMALDRDGYTALFCPMLDMYSDRPIGAVTYATGQPFVEATPYCDRHYWEIKPTSLDRLGSVQRQFVGGPRHRLIYRHHYTPNRWHHEAVRLLAGLHNRLIRPITGRALSKWAPAPWSFKTPLAKWSGGKTDTSYINSHKIHTERTAPAFGALLHFKYFQDFGDRVQAAIASGEHVNGSAEYHQYARYLSENPDATLMADDVVRFESPEQLYAAHPLLAKHLPEWRRLLSS